jgi:26S proteasome regulatory subunit T4
MSSDQEREHALESFKRKLIESREWETKLKNLRLEIKGMQKEFDQTEENIKALQSVGQIIGEVLKQLDDERCLCPCLAMQEDPHSTVLLTPHNK